MSEVIEFSNSGFENEAFILVNVGHASVQFRGFRDNCFIIGF